jgi:hypothetical protein
LAAASEIASVSMGSLSGIGDFFGIAIFPIGYFYDFGNYRFNSQE